MVIIHHRVQDYGKWKPIFDRHAGTRENFGIKGGRIYHVDGDPNDVLIVFDDASGQDFRRFMSESDVADVMRKSGVKGEPQVIVGESESKPKH